MFSVMFVCVSADGMLGVPISPHLGLLKIVYLWPGGRGRRGGGGAHPTLAPFPYPYHIDLFKLFPTTIGKRGIGLRLKGLHIRLCNYVRLFVMKGYYPFPVRISSTFSIVVPVRLVVRDVVKYQKWVVHLEENLQWPGSNSDSCKLHFRNAIIAILGDT